MNFQNRSAFRRRILLVLSLLLGLALQADTHIFAGAAGTNIHDALIFTVAPLYDTQSGYKFPMVLRTNGLHAGHHRGDTLTFTALSSTDQGTGQLLGRALLGSRLAVEVVQVDGPSGGSFAFWEGDSENPGNQITFRVPVGTTNGTSSFVISENNGTPGSDPYGHIHGREFTTTLPGLYTVGFRLRDISTNGINGGPLHRPSSIFSMYFQAGPTLESLQVTPLGMRAFFRSAPGITNVLEATDSLESPSWNIVTGGLRGNTTLQSLTDTQALPGQRFYRLRLLNIPP